MARPDVPYTPYPTAEPEVDSPARLGPHLDVQANPNDFGAQAGEGLQAVGQAGFDTAKHFAQMATEANANDKIVNQWAPTATKLQQNYYSLQGKDAVAGFDPYIQGLQNARNKMVEDASSPAEAQILGAYATRHIAQEYDLGMRHSVQQNTAFEDQSSNGFVDAQTTAAINAGSNPDIINNKIQAGNARIQVHGLDRGMSPEAIKQAQDDFIGKTVSAVVSSAVTRGDIDFANKYYTANKDSIPGFQQVEIDKSLHSENMRQFGLHAANALEGGAPIPYSHDGGPGAVQVRMAAISAAQEAGVDPNHALAVVRIESSDGQNLGTRGDIGQTGKPAANLQEQATNMATELKSAQGTADTALGRAALPWEQYAVYQQGAGGGPALFKADPNARAVDVLRPLYSNPKDAASAITSNGGNLTMSAGQFLDSIKQNYEAQAARAAISTPPGATATLQTPHDTTGPVVQPGATPTQALIQFDKNYPDMLQRANEIPNIDQRQATLSALEQKHTIYLAGANAWKTQFLNQAQTLSVDPKFTSMDQIPADMRSAFADDPNEMLVLQRRADANLERSSGAVTKDQKEYGPGIAQITNDVWSGKITSIQQIHNAYLRGDITAAGNDRAVKELQGSNTPEGFADSSMKKAFFDGAKAQIAGEQGPLKLKLVDGEQQYTRFLAQALPAYEKGISAGKTPMDLLDPDSKDYIGASIPSFQKLAMKNPGESLTNALSDNDNAAAKPSLFSRAESAIGLKPFRTDENNMLFVPRGGNAVKIDSLDGVKQAVRAGMPLADAMKWSLAHGFTRPDGPQVPTGQ